MNLKNGRKQIGISAAAVVAGVGCLFLLNVFGVPSGPAGRPTGGQAVAASGELDAKVTAFLERSRGRWYDMNVPEQDGRLLYDLVIKGGYKRALEIGTSTGLSGTYIAWALSKTGGKLITVEIDPGRHGEAMANFKEAGLSGWIDARLADAHELVPALEGPFDFVFIDADKEWYVEYAKAVIPKLAPGGCIAAHNVSGGTGGGGRRWGRQPGTGEYYDYMAGLSEFETTIRGRQTAVSYKKK
ncbi:MAG: class I SAM-dependent methyltransferase [Candidatus Aminicenantes bacterium]|nr:class I SAM-dependent methyltransferase [Candidatus Aminicenantes bacterium]